MSQAQAIEKHLKYGNSLTGLEAIKKFGVYRLSSVIHRLRKKGLKIHNDMSTGYARYYMPKNLTHLLTDIS